MVVGTVVAVAVAASSNPSVAAAVAVAVATAVAVAVSVATAVAVAVATDAGLPCSFASLPHRRFPGSRRSRTAYLCDTVCHSFCTAYLRISKRYFQVDP